MGGDSQTNMGGDSQTNPSRYIYIPIPLCSSWMCKFAFPVILMEVKIDCHYHKACILGMQFHFSVELQPQVNTYICTCIYTNYTEETIIFPFSNTVVL